MNVNINLKSPSNDSKWNSLQTGDFIIAEGTSEHPIPNGLYQVFIITDTNPNVPKTIIIVPIFDGPFNENMFPYMLPRSPFPILSQKVNNINIIAEVNI
jgi:hypothetical protein